MTAPEPTIVTYEVIGVVRSPFTSLEGMPLQSVAAQDVRGEIELHPRHQAALKDLDGFSHLWVVSHLHRSLPPTDGVVVPFLDDVERGLFATRSPRHPNPIGISVVRLLTIKDATLHVEGLDLLDGTPVLDLKPYVPLFDCIDAERIGWLTHRAETVHTVRADRRFEPGQLPSTEEELLYFVIDPRRQVGTNSDATAPNSTDRAPPRRHRPSVRDVMRTNPKTLPRGATVADVRERFRNPRVSLALLVHRGVCTGTITRTDITTQAHDDDAASWFAQAPQTIHATASLTEAHHRLEQTSDGRLVVVDDRAQLQGLLCHNRAGNGFCNNRSPCGRPEGTTAKKTRWQVIHGSASAQEQQDGLLVATQGKSINLGDLLTLPPETQTRWLVVDVRENPRDDDSGIVTVEPLDQHRERH